MTKIDDVAKKLDIQSRQSLAQLTGTRTFQKKTKEKIFKAMKELNYYPNNIAQQFRGQGTKMVGVVISFITNPFFAYLVDAIERYLSEEGYQVVILQTLEDSKKEAKYIEMLQKKQVDGLIMANLENDNQEVKELVKQGKIVLCNRYLGDEDLPIIQIDEEAAAYEATKYLIQSGYKKIAYCTGGNKNDNDHRFIGFSRALKEACLTIDDAFYFSKMLRMEDGERWVSRQKKIGLPDAVFTNGDEVAAGMVSAAKKEGIEVPQQLAIIGFDDQPLAAVLNPALTTIRQPTKQIGEHAAKVLLANLHRKKIPAIPTFKTKLIIRETT